MTDKHEQDKQTEAAATPAVDALPEIHADAADHQPRSVTPKRSSGRWWRWPMRLLVALMILVGALLALVRYGGVPLAMWQLDRWYSQQGEGYRASLGQWHLSFTDGELMLTDFYLHHPAESEPQARTGWQQLRLDIDTRQLLALVKNRLFNAEQPAPPLVIEDVTLAGLELAGHSDMNREDGSSQVNVAGLVLPLPDEDSQQPEPEAKSESALAVQLQQLAFSQWQLAWQHQDQQADLKAQLALVLPELGLHNLDTRSGVPLDVNLDAQLKQLAVSLPAPAGTPLARPVSLSLQQPFQMALEGKVHDWQQGQARLQGNLSLNQLKLRAMQDMTIALKHLGVQQLEASATGQAFTSLELSDFALSFDSSPDTSVELYRYLSAGFQFDPKHRGLPLLTMGKQNLEGLALSANLTEQGLPVGLTWLNLPDQASTSSASSGTSQSSDTTRPSDKAKPSDKAQTAAGLPLLVKTQPIALRKLSLALTHPQIQTGVSIPELNLGAVDSEQVASIKQDGKLVVESLTLPQADTYLLEPLTLNWGVQLHDWLRQPRVTGQAQLTGLALQSQQQPQVFLNRLSLQGLDASATRQNVETLTLEGLKVQHAPERVDKTLRNLNKPLLTLAQLVVPKLAFEKQQLSTGVIRFAGARMSVLKRANGQLAGIPEPSKEKAQSAPKEPAQPPAAPAVQVSIRGLKQSGEASRLQWLDRSVEPAYQANVTLHSLAVGVVNTGRFDFARAGLSTPLIPVSAVLGLDEFNRIRFKGKAGLADGVPAGEYTLDIEQLNMVPLSPYVTQAMGYRIQKGMLDLDVDLDIKQGNMDGKADITLQNSQFEPADEDIINSVSKQIAMPVETALSVLKDDENNIHLEVPLKGPLDDPSVGLNDVLAKVSTTAIRSATLFYLKQSIQPYGALISLGSLVADEVFAIRLDPLDYQPYHYLLTEKQDDYLKHVVELMHSKPDLELQVCPFYSAAEAQAPERKTEKPETEQSDTDKTEKPASEPALAGVALAQARAVQIKQRLAAFKDEKQRSLARRVTLCAPQQGEKATVEMGF
ncbi:MAG: DUF748 domain-containing protein [Oceanobacter sp.]